MKIVKNSPLASAAALLSSLISLVFFFLLPIPAAASLALIQIATAAALVVITARLKDINRRGSDITLEFQALIDTLPDGVLIYGENFTILFVNRELEKIAGVSREKIINQKITPTSGENPALRVLSQILYPSLAPSASQISDSEWPQITEIRLDAPELILRTTSNKIAFGAENRTQFIKIVEDKTRAEKIMQSKSEFLNTAAHQLRTPVTAMSWAFDALAKEIQDANLKPIIEEGSRTAARALKTVNDLLNAARIEEGKFGYTFQETDIVKLIEDTVTQAKVVARETGINLAFQAPIEPILTRVDPQHIGIALANILDNAIRYNTKGGRVTVSIKRLLETPFIKISVADTGVGVPPADTSKIFTKFFRASNITQIVPDGTGLGLYIAKNIIKNHGGEIGLESEETRGSTFWFTLPTDPNRAPQSETAYASE